MKNLEKIFKQDFISSLLEDRKGTTAITMALISPLIFAGLAFGSEYGYFEHSKRRLQNAADTAAFAAGTQLRSGLGQSEMEYAATLIAEDSGYDNSVGTLTLVSPPTTGAYAGDNDAVHVTLSQPVDRRFSKIYDSSEFRLTVQSTVLVRNGRPACILSLNPSMDEAVLISGNTEVELTGCDFAANSISSSAVASNGGSADATTSCVSTVGNVDDSHGAFTYTDCDDPIENSPVTKDPYKDVAEPTCASYQNASQFTNVGGNPANPGSGIAGTVNCYQNVNSLSKDVILKPNEVYVLHNSDLQLNGGRSIFGDNIMIFLSGSSSITINGNSTVDISAMTSGTWSGIALFGNRDNEVDMQLTGNSGVTIVGAIYSPYYDLATGDASDIDYKGNTASFTAGECTQVIGGGQVEFTGDSEFSTDCTNSGTNAIMAAQAISVVE